MAQLTRVPMAWEEFLALPEQPRAEWVDGVAVLGGVPGTFEHGSAVAQVGVLLSGALAGTRVEVALGVGVALPRNRLRAPDVTVVGERPSGGWVIRPPLAVVEVVSAATRSEDTIRKSMEYAEGGVGQYWVVDPDLRAIDLWRNAEGEWELLARVDDHHPTAAVELAGVTVPLDLRQVLRD